MVYSVQKFAAQFQINSLRKGLFEGKHIDPDKVIIQVIILEG